MASRFVSGGVIDTTSGETVDAETTGRAGQSAPLSKRRQEEWEAVQKELEAERRQREERRRAEGEAGGERSLFEVLQANKGA